MNETRPSRFRAYAALFRLSGALTPAADVVTGYFALPAAPHRPVSYLAFGCACLASMALFCAGAALNDLVDRRRDAARAPHRPLPSGALTPRQARTAVFVAAGAALGLGAAAGPWTLAAVGLVLLLAVLYDLWTRRRVWGGVLTLAAVRAADLLVGASLHCSSGTFPDILHAGEGPAVPGAWVMVLYGGYAAFLSLTALAERGERRPAPFLAVLAVASALPPAVAAGRAGYPVPAAVLAGVLALPAYRHFTGPDAARVEHLVGHFVSGYFLLGALWVLGRGRVEACALLWAGYFASRAVARAFPAG